MPPSPSIQTQSRLADKPHVEIQAGQYLTFRVARQDFAVQAAVVRGILSASDLQPAIPSPNLYHLFGAWICGFATLRGQEIPVVDLRGRLALPHAAHGRHPCVIVVETGTVQNPRLTGFVADRVSALIHARDRDFSFGKLYRGGRSRRVFDPAVLVA
jgi:chemotaxis signal transduction protein